MAAFTQHLQIKNDTAIVLIEKGQELTLDSTTINLKIQQVRQSVQMSDNRLLQIEAARAKELTKKTGFQSTLTYFLEIRDKYQKLKTQLKNEK